MRGSGSSDVAAIFPFIGEASSDLRSPILCFNKDTAIDSYFFCLYWLVCCNFFWFFFFFFYSFFLFSFFLFIFFLFSFFLFPFFVFFFVFFFPFSFFSFFIIIFIFSFFYFFYVCFFCFSGGGWERGVQLMVYVWRCPIPG